jgi:hypothetical protein
LYHLPWHPERVHMLSLQRWAQCHNKGKERGLGRGGLLKLTLIARTLERISKQDRVLNQQVWTRSVVQQVVMKLRIQCFVSASQWCEGVIHERGIICQPILASWKDGLNGIWRQGKGLGSQKDLVEVLQVLRWLGWQCFGSLWPSSGIRHEIWNQSKTGTWNKRNNYRWKSGQNLKGLSVPRLHQKN